MRPFRFGLLTGGAASPEAWLALAREAEQSGFGCLMMPDHLGRQATFPALMAAGSVTSTIKLASYVFNQDWRPPAILAQDAATVQILTGGRLELGVGAGWARHEYEQVGLQYDSPAVRVARFDEYMQILKDMLAAREPYSFDGQYFHLNAYQPLPKSQHGPPPILIGGGSQRILTTAGRLADIISISTRATPDGRVDMPNISLAAVEKKVAWIRAAAGDRFGQIELNMTVRETRLTSDRRAAARQILNDWSAMPRRLAHVDTLSEQDVLDSPHIAIGTADEIAEQFSRYRERWGIAYYQVGGNDRAAIAPVMDRLLERQAVAQV